ncbi:hypothetical protein SAMN05444385_105198 [Tritonibacter mobilis]|nr:hypothetical protein SAMN05444385_105198 [Tritonibacter mobilis]
MELNASQRRGYRKLTITYPHFGLNPVEVCAIRVN